MAADFVVVGGGIGGAVLAGLLGRGGKRVVVLEKSLAPPHWVRPEILWPGTMEALFSLRPREFWEEEAVLPMRGFEFQDGQRTVPVITADVLRDAGVQPWFTNPNQTREQLLRLGSFELRRGVEVIAILKEKSRIVGVRTRDIATREEGEVIAPYTVGDDGAQSLVRKACGIDMKTRAFPIDFICFGCDWPAAVPSGTGRFWLNSKWASGIVGLAIMPLPNGKGAGLVPVLSRSFDAIPSVEASWNRFCAADPTIREVVQDRRFPHDFVRIRRPWGHAPRYGGEGAILMGDAAHPVSPAGGQGANMSVADACVLAELALGNHRNLLAEYERRRRPANARSISPTRTVALILSLPRWLSPFSVFFAIVRSVARYPSLLRHFLRSSSTMFQERGV
jgi:2-polyprenyl-6-methoxyphenol hydroxylase-like FAD-dependent oxidoreductase